MSESLTPATMQNPTHANFRLSEVPGGVEVEPVTLVAEDGALSKGMFYRPTGVRPRVGVHLMHPRTDQTQNYNILPLVQAGYAVLGRAGRWPNNDVSTIHETLLLDMAAGVRHLREQGCEQVVLLGNSGGSSLAAFYQAQARTEPPGRLSQTPAGDPPDLNQYDLPAADGLIIVAGHIGQGLLLGKLLDPSVIDEADPLASDPALDPFNPDNGFVEPPASSHYSAEFLDCYHVAQQARVARLDAIAHELLRRQREAAAMATDCKDARLRQRLERAAQGARYMAIYRTAADPAMVDLSIEPDDRIVCTYLGRRPDLENYSHNGFASYLSPRAWLSTWSGNASNARTLDNLARIADPFLVVHYRGDVGTRLSEVRAMVEHSAAADKQSVIIPGADHYGFVIHADGTLGPRDSAGTDQVVAWMRDRFQP